MAKNSLHSFLASRCSPRFLSQYLQHDSDLLTEVSRPGLLLYAVSEVPLAKRLHEFGLLPERHRRKFVNTVSGYALDGQDASALDGKSVRSMFTKNEFVKLVQRIRLETLPRLDDIRSECEDLEFLEVVSPEDQMHPFFEFCDSLLSQFGDDQDTSEWIDQQVSLAWNWVNENQEYWPDEDPTAVGRNRRDGRTGRLT